MKNKILARTFFIFCAAFPIASSAVEITWETEYRAAYDKARAENKMLFIEFHQGKTIAPKFNAEEIEDHVFLALDFEQSETMKGLRRHKAFSHLETSSGWVVIDYKNTSFKTYGSVVSVMPAQKLTRKNFQILTHLPMGTLTQRTMIWAVQQHPYRPQSTSGKLRTDFLEYVEGWALEMARSSYQRHGSHPGSSEIVAETFDGEGTEVTEAAESLISMWGSAYDYQRSGHWSAVLSGWSGYAYDMAYQPHKRTWYAVGVFAGPARTGLGEIIPGPRGTNLKQIIRQK